jgi:hypothetical protein
MSAVEVGIELGDAGLRWVEQSLDEGLAISEAFLGRSILRSMRCIALVPSDTPLHLLDDLAADSFPSRRRVGLEHLASFLEQCCKEGGIFVVEDELANPDDEWIREQGLGFPHFACEEELYHWLALWPATGTETIEEFLNEATAGYPTNAFVLRSSVDEFDKAKESPSAVAAAVDAVVVSAYDDVAYVAAIPRQ